MSSLSRPTRLLPGVARSLSPSGRRVVRSLIDIAVLASALGLAYLLRFDFDVPAGWAARFRLQVLAVVALQLGALWMSGSMKIVWRYVSLADVPTFLRAACLWTVPMVALRFLWTDPTLNSRLPLSIPLSVSLFDTTIAVVGLLGVRVVTRALFEREQVERTGATSEFDGVTPVLLVGAGRAGVLALREIKGRGDMGIHAVAFVDDDPLKQGSVVGGLEVVGTTADLPHLVPSLDIKQVIITIAEADRASIRRIVEICEDIPVTVRSIPGYFDLLRGNVSIRRIRDVEPDLLLGRQAVNLESERIENLLADKAVLVTGGGGSIGSELALQAARFRPATLLLVERSEYALFEVHRKLSDLWPELPIVPMIGDCGDEQRMREVLEACKPDILVHVAAHKHVPLMEGNPAEAVKNNLLATRLMGTLAAEVGVGTFVLISTDKAVRPRSIMGASKRAAEMVIQDLDRRHETAYSAVRFGNVLGSTGSVIPIFNDQISRGGPVTVTDERMTRYFMSISEAAQLVLTAASFTKGGEIFILDMGEPVPIVRLAEQLITLSGFEPYKDIDIVFTGARPGEKIHEELRTADEELVPTADPKIFVTAAAPPPIHLQEAVAELERMVDVGASADSIREALHALIPDSRLTSSVDSMP